MNKFERDLQALRELRDKRLLQGKTREDYPEGLERDAFDVWRFLVVRQEMAEYGEEEHDPGTYEEALAYLRDLESEISLEEE
jgi:hypothetical protein